MVKVDSIFLTTTIIHRVDGKVNKGTATAFFYTNKDKIYLVTNKHVIYGNKFFCEGCKPEIDKLQLVLHTNVSNLAQNEKVEIVLVKNKNRLWLEHQQKDIDLICVQINLDRQKFVFFPIADDLLDAGQIKIGFEKIFVMGYPFGWYDSKFNLPITRIGHLSSPFGIPFDGQPYMLGDVETHKGMSGSPVFMYLKDYLINNESGGFTMNLGSTKILLLGIYSGQPNWQIPDSITNDIRSIPNSLSIIWFASLIRDIVSQ